MQGLIEALTIFLKYGNPAHPTHCEHDVLYVQIDPSGVAQADKDRLAELGFHPDEDTETSFYSFRYGRA